MTCMVCHGPFDCDIYMPWVLPCGHTTCANCLSLLPAPLLCPMCRKWFARSAANINYALRDLIMDHPSLTQDRPCRRTIRKDSVVRRFGEKGFFGCPGPCGNILMVHETIVEFNEDCYLVRGLGKGYLDYPEGGVAYSKRRDEVIVAEARKDRLSVFSYTNGELLRHLGTKAGLDRPRGIALSGSYCVLVADSGNNRIVSLSLDTGLIMFSLFDNLDGSFLHGLRRPSAVAFDPITDRVFVTEPALHRISVFNASTKLAVGTIGSHGSGDGQFDNPRQVSVDGVGQIAVADRDNKRVCIFAKDLSFVRWIPVVGGFPDSVVVDRFGDLVVSTSE